MSDVNSSTSSSSASDLAAPDPSTPPASFTLVAVGASAGGLDALERFFDRIPADTGAAFVVVQHLSPDHKSMMAALLARHTTMPVVTATEGMVLLPNRIHLIPPGQLLRLQGDLLTLAPKAPRVLTLPIDVFFTSAAEERGARTIGVILSGTGTDGTRGAGAIHQAEGLLAAQSPSDARFDGMPHSVIATGLVDCILPVDELGPWVTDILAHGAPRRFTAPDPQPPDDDGDDPHYDILRVLSVHSGVQFADYKPGTIRRRIERRMLLRRMVDITQYRDTILTDPEEADALRREVLVSVTRFFRDPDAFQALGPQIDLLVREAHEARRPLRLWSAATASGEEAYSLAILALEACARQGLWPGVKVFATDASADNIDAASAGSYPESAAEEMASGLAERYFTLREGRLTVRPELRQCMVFARHNLLSDAPFTRIDLVACRNMLIYLRPSAQERALTRLHYALRPGGILFLGGSEMIPEPNSIFQPINSQQRIWRLASQAARPSISGDGNLPLTRAMAPRDRYVRPAGHSATMVETGHARLLGAFAPPPAVLLNGANEVVHSYGDVGPFIQLRPGAVSLDILRLVPDPLVPVATALLFRAKRLEDAAPQASHYVLLPGDGVRPDKLVRLTVLPLTIGEDLAKLLVFEAISADTTGAAIQTVDIGWETSERLDLLESELSATRETLRGTIEEMEAASEELQATNEEMMASNEELQSANEELQSVNEELNTVNAEFQEKIEILNRMNADLEGLTRVVPMGAIFVDHEMCVTRFSPDTLRLFNLREADIGRPLADLSHRLAYPQLIPDLEQALKDNQPRQREAAASEGQSYLVRILPYRLPTSTESAAVLSFVDITESRVLQKLQATLDGLSEQVAVLDAFGRIDMVNAAWTRFALENGGDPARLGPGCDYLGVCTSDQGDAAALAVAEGLRRVLSGQEARFRMEYPCDSPDRRRWFRLHVQALPEGFKGAVVSHLDLSDWKYPAQAGD